MTVYTRILVPLDGSELAERVLPYVSLLGNRLQSRIELLRVIEPISDELSDPDHGVDPHRISASMVSHAQDYLAKVAASLNNEGLTVSCTVHEGDPASYIVGEAEKDPDTLVAISTHGRSGIRRWTLGSVTDKVLQATINPLLIIRAGDQEATTTEVKLKTVIVPLDGSPVGEGILPHLTPLVAALGLKVTLLQVTPPAEEYYRYMDYPVADYGDLSKEVDTQALAYFCRVSRKLRQQGVSSIEERLIHGHPAAAIVDYASKTPDSLVAMGTHGRSGVGRWILGSVTDRVVQQSGDPVLVIRSEK
ncbi:MAG: universal stress protein [Dehalococcoidia bacterium]